MVFPNIFREKSLTVETSHQEVTHEVLEVVEAVPVVRLSDLDNLAPQTVQVCIIPRRVHIEIVMEAVRCPERPELGAVAFIREVALNNERFHVTELSSPVDGGELALDVLGGVQIPANLQLCNNLLNSHHCSPPFHVRNEVLDRAARSPVEVGEQESQDLATHREVAALGIGIVSAEAVQPDAEQGQDGVLHDRACVRAFLLPVPAALSTPGLGQIGTALPHVVLGRLPVGKHDLVDFIAPAIALANVLAMRTHIRIAIHGRSPPQNTETRSRTSAAP